jgi:TRAP-type mannitol/chloroaromatic compound transport system permease small subunit
MGVPLFKRWIQAIDRVIERAASIALITSGVMIFIMAWLSTYGVARRYMLNSPEPYSYELSTIFLVACVLLAIAGVQRLGRQLRVDFIAIRFSEGVQDALINILAPVLALFYVILLTWQSWDAAWYSMQVGEISQSAWREPWWPTKMVVPVGAGLLCLVLIAQLGHGVTSLIRRIKKVRE